MAACAIADERRPPLSAGAVRVAPLAEHREHLGHIAQWLHQQWFERRGLSPADVMRRLEPRLQLDQPPFSMVAMAGREPVGTVSIVEEDNPIGPGTLPCLAELYVPEAWRRRGIGSALCDAAQERARGMQLGVLALFTVDNESFYRKRGWQAAMDTVVPLGHEMVCASFMTRPLAPMPSNA